MSDYLVNMVNSVNGDPRWKMLENMYDNWQNKTDRQQKIPKIIHQIWLGGEYPEKYIPFRDKMMELNKGWEYKLWTDKDVESFGLKNIKLFNNIKNLGAKADIFRYEILERMGGLYLDTDFECTKSFDDLVDLSFFAGNGHIDQPEVFNSLMASEPNHKFVSALVSELQKKNSFVDNIDGVMNNTGPYFITRVFFNTINESDNVVVFPTKFFFPFPAVYRHMAYESAQNFIRSFITDRTYCIHLWHTTWQK